MREVTDWKRIAGAGKVFREVIRPTLVMCESARRHHSGVAITFSFEFVKLFYLGAAVRLITSESEIGFIGIGRGYGFLLSAAC